MKNRLIYNNLSKLYKKAGVIKISNKDKFVIFSDLHMGNGGRRDDFAKNSKLFNHILEHYYLKKNYKLILNGDIEELHKFVFKKVVRQWKNVYQSFDAFKKRNNLIKITGNHDYKLNLKKYFKEKTGDVTEAVKLDYKGNIIFIFHGHQASGLLAKFNTLIGFILHYIALPLQIKNWEVPYNSKKKFKTERNVYEFSCNKKIISIIGHTHRPLFQSLSKIDLLRFEIEQLCRGYLLANKKDRPRIEKAVKTYKKELLSYYDKKHKKEELQSTLYNSNLFVPSLFNSGCVIGRWGITAIEINNGQIKLVHWFDKNKRNKYLDYSHPGPERLDKSSFYKITFNREFLSYIFTRIKLLS